MTTGLTRGAYAGRETLLQMNIGTLAAAIWVTIARARNVQTNRGPAFGAVEFHGAESTGQVPGYRQFSGSFEYVRRRGVDTVYNRIRAARDAGDAVQLRYLNGQEDEPGVEGWKAPVLFGETTSTANGSEGVTETFPFSKADAFGSDGASVEVEDVVTSAAA